MTDMGVISLITQATLVVKIVLAILGMMSIISWSIIFLKLITLSRAKQKLSQDVDTFLAAGDLREAIHQVGANHGSTAYPVAQEGVKEIHRMEGLDASSRETVEIVRDGVRRALRRGVNEQLAKLSSSLSFLATCANAAPFIGLFGTVWGIMHSFHAIGQMKTAALAAVAPGISEALVATAIGLVVAIPATVAYNFFMGRLGLIEAELINFAGVFLNRVQRELPALTKPGKRQ